jgi:hypothetical protein
MACVKLRVACAKLPVACATTIPTLPSHSVYLFRLRALGSGWPAALGYKYLQVGAASRSTTMGARIQNFFGFNLKIIPELGKL